MGEFRLGAVSLKVLEGVHPDLVAVVKRAIDLTGQGLLVHDDIRKLREQKRLVERGASKMLDSRHITGHANATRPDRIDYRDRPYDPIFVSLPDQYPEI